MVSLDINHYLDKGRKVRDSDRKYGNIKCQLGRMIIN
jgi:hypothetical protein